jgi:amidase
MGSLRNPAGWCEVLSVRPTAGPPPTPGDDLSAVVAAVEGPMARDARDLALLHSVMAGPLAVPTVDPAAMRVGWLADLGGYLPTEAGVLPLVPRGAWHGPESLWPAWLALRHLLAGTSLAGDYDAAASVDLLPATVRFEVEGLRGAAGVPPLAPGAVASAVAVRVSLWQAMADLFRHCDVLALPTAQVFPFPAGWSHPSEIAGVPMSTYHRWMEVTTLATLVGVPVLTVPAGRDARGLPMGVQILAPHGREDLLLGLASAW